MRTCRTDDNIGTTGFPVGRRRDLAKPSRRSWLDRCGRGSQVLKLRYPIIIDWCLPIGCLLGLTILFWTTHLDIDMVSRFYTPGAGWALGQEPPWIFLYNYGVVPAWLIAISALCIFVGSLWAKRLLTYRRAAVFLVLVMLVGPGLMVNVVFKQNWGRPRPRDIVEFHGDREFVQPWVKSPRENGNSFASGHASMGFYLLVPYFLIRRRSKLWAAVVLGFGLAYGSIMGVARMAQGAHFPSDVLWALGCVYLSGLVIFYLLALDRDPSANPG